MGRIVYAGKESNRLDEVDAGVLHDEAEYLNVYKEPRRDPWVIETLPVLKRISTGDLIRALKVGRSTAKRWKAGQARPRSGTLEMVRRLVRDRR
ncbi:MAG TPA: hypothetical protein VI056_05540 [Candidatus Limnocylindria bacterium]